MGGDGAEGKQQSNAGWRGKMSGTGLKKEEVADEGMLLFNAGNATSEMS